MAGRRLQQRWVRATILSMILGLLLGSLWGFGSLWFRGSLSPFGLLLLPLGICQRGVGAVLCLVLGIVFEGAAILGLLVGWRQQRLLKDWIASPAGWIAMTMLCWAIFSMAIFNLTVQLSGSVLSTIASALVAIASGSGLGYFQALQLEGQLPQSQQWLRLHIVMSIVAVLLLGLTEVIGQRLGLGALGAVLLLAIAIPSYAIATGKTLARLTKQAELV